MRSPALAILENFLKWRTACRFVIVFTKGKMRESYRPVNVAANGKPHWGRIEPVVSSHIRRVLRRETCDRIVTFVNLFFVNKIAEIESAIEQLSPER